jgi:predicted metalloprotease with PDZ domain
MIDTTRDPIIAARNPLPWKSWQRSEDYYSEGALVWLDVDTRLRELTGESRSLDDFARSFFGADDDRPVTHTYEFEDVVNTLNRIAEFDWRAMFAHLITETRSGAPLAGIERGGYRLVFRAEPNAYTQGSAEITGATDLSFSIGLTTDGTGKISDVLWDGPAFTLGIISGSSILAVNGRKFSIEILKQAIAETLSGQKLRLIVESGRWIRELTFDYDGGLRFPHLERIDGTPARLDQLLAPL